jgi:hypothetical protein
LPCLAEVHRTPIAASLAWQMGAKFWRRTLVERWRNLG